MRSEMIRRLLFSIGLVLLAGTASAEVFTTRYPGYYSYQTLWKWKNYDQMRRDPSSELVMTAFNPSTTGNYDSTSCIVPQYSLPIGTTFAPTASGKNWTPQTTKPFMANAVTVVLVGGTVAPTNAGLRLTFHRWDGGSQDSSYTAVLPSNGSATMSATYRFFFQSNTAGNNFRIVKVFVEQSSGSNNFDGYARFVWE
jgi:hypothetical protein